MASPPPPDKRERSCCDYLLQIINTSFAANCLNSWKRSQCLSAFENQDIDLNIFMLNGSIHRPNYLLWKIWRQPWTQILKDVLETHVHIIQQKTFMNLWFTYPNGNWIQRGCWDPSHRYRIFIVLIPAVTCTKQLAVSEKHNPCTKYFREQNEGEGVKRVMGCIVTG